MASEVYNTDDKRILIHSGKDATDVPSIYVGEDSVAIDSPTGSNSIEISEMGTGFSGPMSIQATPEEIRFGGFWKINPMTVTAVPSSVYTPTPWVVKSPPKPPTEMIEGFVRVAALIAGLAL